jgi:hypothetical protein
VCQAQCCLDIERLSVLVPEFAWVSTTQSAIHRKTLALPSSWQPIPFTLVLVIPTEPEQGSIRSDVVRDFRPGAIHLPRLVSV